MTILTHLVLVYKFTGDNYDNLVEHIMLFIYNFSKYRRRFNSDDRSEFLLAIAHRIPGFIERFVYSQREFEIYLVSILKWQVKTYFRKMLDIQRRHHAQYAADTNEYTDWLYASEQVVQFSPSAELLKSPKPAMVAATAEKIDIRLPSRYLIIITLKACMWLEDRHLISIAQQADCDIQWLLGVIHRLRQKVLFRRQRLDRARQRRYRQFMNLLSLQADIYNDNTGAERARIADDLERCRQQFHVAVGNVSRLAASPTNVEIADELSIPKGSVDSSIFYAKRMLSGMSSDAESGSSKPHGFESSNFQSYRPEAL